MQQSINKYFDLFFYFAIRLNATPNAFFIKNLLHFLIINSKIYFSTTRYDIFLKLGYLVKAFIHFQTNINLLGIVNKFTF